jgi:hypothetical protein
VKKASQNENFRNLGQNFEVVEIKKIKNCTGKIENVKK